MTMTRPGRIYRLLLLAFPPEFRRQFEHEMMAAFEEQLAGARRQGHGRAIWLLLRTLVQLPVHGALERLREFRHAGLRLSGSDITSALAFGWRRCIRQPRNTLLAVTVLAVGFAASTVSFSILYGTVLRGLPFDRAEQLVHFERARGDDNLPVTPHDYLDWREQQQSFEDLAAYVEALALFGNDDRQQGVSIEPAAFALLRASAALGRTFLPSDVSAGAPAVMLLSDRLWRERFGADPAIVSQDIIVNDRPTRVVGVMPPGFGFPIAEAFWVPLDVQTTGLQRGQGRLDVFGRLRPGVAFAQAREEFSLISARLAQAHIENADIDADLKTFRAEYIGDEFETRVRSLLFGAGLVMLIASLNAAVLLLTRQSARAGESALLSALGASSGRLVTQSVGEAAVLAAGGAAVGLPLSALCVRWVSSAWTNLAFFDLPHGPAAPFWWSIELDAAALVFAAACLGCTALVVGLLPAWRLSRLAGHDALKASGGSRIAGPGRLAETLVIGQLAVMTALMVPVVLAAESASSLARVGTALSPEGVMTARVTLSGGAGTNADATRIAETLSVDPRLRGTAFTTALPFQVARNTRLATEFSAATPETELPFARIATVSASFFELFSVTALSGRVLTHTDNAGSSPVVLVNASAAERFFPGLDHPGLIGRRIRLGASTSDWVTVVGVVPDLWMAGDRNRNPAGVYVPLGQSAAADPAWTAGRWGSVFLLARARGSEREAEQAIRDAVRGVSLSLVVYDVMAMRRVVGTRAARFEVYGVLYLIFGGIAVVLAVTGTYGVNALVAGVRRKEVGIRMAMGATPAGIVGQMLQRGLIQIALGATLGLIGAYWLVEGMAQAFFQVVPYQAPAFVLAVATVVVAGLLASVGPARKASRVDPLSVLRTD